MVHTHLVAAVVAAALAVGGPIGAAEPQAPARPAASPAPPSAARSLQIAFDLAYNLDHEQAAAVLEQAMRDHPDDASLPRAHATLTWLNLLFRRGMVLVENYLGPVSKDDVKVPSAPPTRDPDLPDPGRALDCAVRGAASKRRPNDPAAIYELGAALGLQASWAATIDGRVMGAFGSARRAYNLHERVMALAPAARRRGPHRRHLSLPGRQPGVARPLAGLHGRLRRRQGEGARA